MLTIADEVIEQAGGLDVDVIYSLHSARGAGGKTLLQISVDTNPGIDVSGKLTLTNCARAGTAPGFLIRRETSAGVQSKARRLQIPCCLQGGLYKYNRQSTVDYTKFPVFSPDLTGRGKRRSRQGCIREQHGAVANLAQTPTLLHPERLESPSLPSPASAGQSHMARRAPSPRRGPASGGG
jgi:hypothetical protein